eukprot:CAMPEP_0174250956 /NCGR_PEP_ID=MMETSP0439-20130205/947_1 /TAXON_ID=0 /ORGANISM="Stereomyxa ramosa, Strain Chinc5" /LENGTH=1084 /DNA_ID=CAMNT_0015331151 /DNA_START=59 /DNA_END=3313 /DNA_ORIENTATION=+
MEEGEGSWRSSTARKIELEFHRLIRDNHLDLLSKQWHIVKDHEEQVTDQRGTNALHCAAQYSNQEVFQFFLDQDAFPIDLSDNLGKTALMYACENKSLEPAALILKKLKEVGGEEKVSEEVRKVSKSRDLPLHFILKNTPTKDGDWEKYFFLLDVLLDESEGKKQLIRARNSDGDTPLHVAVSSSKPEVRICRFLLQHKADINQTNKFGYTCLHLAVKAASLELVKFLLTPLWGADASISSSSGTALEMATEAGNEEIKRLLSEAVSTQQQEKTESASKIADVPSKTKPNFANATKSIIGDISQRKNKLQKTTIKDKGFTVERQDGWNSKSSGEATATKAQLTKNSETITRTVSSPNANHSSLDFSKVDASNSTPIPNSARSINNRAKSTTVTVNQIKAAADLNSPNEPKAGNIVPIMINITLPQNLGGTIHQVVLHENCSIDSVKIKLWQSVPRLGVSGGPSRHDYNFFILKTKELIDVDFKKILSYDTVARLYEAKKKIKMHLVFKGTEVIYSQKQQQEQEKEQKREDEENPWKIEADRLAEKCEELNDTIYQMQKSLTLWRDNVITELKSPTLESDKSVILQFVLAKITTILTGDDDVDSESESDEEIEVADGCTFLPRKIDSSIFERFGGAASWTGKTSQTKQKSSRKMTPEEHLERIRYEIIETEETYVAALNILVNLYYIPMTEQQICKQEDARVIFGTIPQINQVHTQLLEKLTSTEKGDITGIVQAFRYILPFLKLYVSFVNDFDKAVARVEKLNKNRQIAAFFNEVKSKPECKKLDLEGFLITPIQRPPRYELLFRDLLKHVPEEAEDERNMIENLLEKVKEINMLINEQKREHESRQRQYKLNELAKPKGIDIFSRPDRTLIKEDYMPIKPLELVTRSERGSMILGNLKFRYRYFFLFDDLFFELRILKSGKYKSLHIFDLENLRVKYTLNEMDDDSDEVCDESFTCQKLENTLTFVLVEKSIDKDTEMEIVKEMVVKASSMEEKLDWMTKIKRVCWSLKENKRKKAEEEKQRAIEAANNNNNNSAPDQESASNGSEPSSSEKDARKSKGKGPRKSLFHRRSKGKKVKVKKKAK